MKQQIIEALEILVGKDPITFAVPVFACMIALELWLYRKEYSAHFDTKDAFASIAMGAGSIFTNLSSKIFFFILFSWIQRNYGIWEWDIKSPISWIILVFLDDFAFYWHHRCSHEIRFLWASHSNHHSSQYYNFATALRQSWTEYLYKYTFWLFIPLLGFPAEMILTMVSFSLIYQFFLHTETVRNLGILEYFMNTPSHHRVHHATNPLYLDRNHAGIFILWDRLFGTFQKEIPEEIPKYGITVPLKTYHPWKIAFAEYNRLWTDMKHFPGIMNAVLLCIKLPGWLPNGKGQTSEDLRKNYTLQKK